MNNTTERGKRGRTPPEDDGARKRQKVGEDGPATGKDGERTETNSTAAGPSQRCAWNARVDRLPLSDLAFFARRRLPHRDPQSDRGRFPSIYIRSVPRTAPGIEPLKARYDLQRLHQRLELAEDEKNRFRPRSLAALVEYLTPAQLSPTSVSPLRRLGQGYTASEYVSLRTAERLRLNALDPMRTLVLVAHAPPDDAAFLPLERLGCDLHSPTTDFLVPLAHAVTSLYKMTVRMVVSPVRGAGDGYGQAHDGSGVQDFEEYAPDRRVMQARQEEDQGDLWTTQATDEEQSAYFATLRGRLHFNEDFALDRNLTSIMRCPALVAATPGEVSLVACGGVAMGALNLDHFGPDTKRQVGLTSPNIASAAAIPHPASVMRLTLRHDRTEAVIASLAQIHELLPTRAYRLGALAGEQISLRRLYERFVEGQRVYKVPERRRVSSYEELPQVGNIDVRCSRSPADYRSPDSRSSRCCATARLRSRQRCPESRLGCTSRAVLGSVGRLDRGVDTHEPDPP